MLIRGGFAQIYFNSSNLQLSVAQTTLPQTKWTRLEKIADINWIHIRWCETPQNKISNPRDKVLDLVGLQFHYARELNLTLCLASYNVGWVSLLIF
ncbi:hypothetical protein VNO77_39340 [Canavalia gladiata]|uniref:Uncharacterized protein n=1 Tax=Canavalia gladiata TaxID=3824 RepID=A0AAN9KC04_CANGL